MGDFARLPKRLLSAGAGQDVWLFDEDVSYSRSQLRTEVDSMVHAFSALGIDQTSTVALRLEPNTTYIYALLALWSCGAEVLLIDFRVPDSECTRFISQMEPQYVVSGPQETGPVLPLGPEGGLTVRHRPEGDGKTSEFCLLQFSSGTTGRPKIIGRTSESILAELDRHVTVQGMLGSDDRVLVLNSIMHTMGLVSGVLHALDVGAAVVRPATQRPTDVLELASSTGVTTIFGVPAHYNLLTQVRSYPTLPQLRLAVSGGDLLPCDTWDEFRRRWSVAISQVYGITEVGLLLAGIRTGEPPPAIGVEVPGVQTRMVEAELQVRMERSPYLTDHPGWLPQGWLRTFDRFERDSATGALKHRGRADSLVSIGGLKVDLAEIENVLTQHPGVRTAVVVHGHVVEAFVEADDDLTHDELTRWCKQQLSQVKTPKHFRLMPRLPRNGAGKLVRDRDQLKRLAQSNPPERTSQ